ncbi:hypothetical protein QZM22_05380 [Burkholderia oklahomensis]|nr:hypothetical protein [Burkholderia oklahomensis]MDN7671966.1 hypothetical protein [Burkholderia oklahomensis]
MKESFIRSAPQKDIEAPTPMHPRCADRTASTGGEGGGAHIGRRIADGTRAACGIASLTVPASAVGDRIGGGFGERIGNGSRATSANPILRSRRANGPADARILPARFGDDKSNAAPRGTASTKGKATAIATSCSC